jgi:hypothetical protein
MIKGLNKFFLCDVIEIKRSVVMALDAVLSSDESMAKLISERFNLDLLVA